jgi:hypothetical protein
MAMTARSDRTVDPLPTGECWCGCGESTSEGNFFLPGHDKVAESAVINIEYGSVASFLLEHDYGPAGRTRVTSSRTGGEVEERPVDEPG